MATTEERLAAIEVNQERTIVLMEQMSKTVETRIEHTDAWRERVDLILVGDGTSRTGHNVRLDRLEQSGERQRWLVRVLGGGMALMVLKSVMDLLG